MDFGIENRSTINQKSIQRAIENMMQVGMDFGWLLDRFLRDLGPKLGVQVGTKLAPKSEEMGYQDDVKESLKTWRRGGP